MTTIPLGGGPSVADPFRNHSVDRSVCPIHGTFPCENVDTEYAEPNLESTIVTTENVSLGEAAMSDSNHTLSIIPPAEPPRPGCPTCGVPMWLVSIQHFADGNPEKDRLHYECQACDGKAVVPALK